MRQVAVLSMHGGPDPDQAARVAERMNEARRFALQNPDILDHPGKGFSILGADCSEHSASRFRGGVFGWMEAQGASDPWSKHVAAIAFPHEGEGAVSEVTTSPEGVFLVRIMEIEPAVTRPFESVAAELEQTKRARLHQEIEKAFEQQIRSTHPVHWPPGSQPVEP